MSNRKLKVHRKLEVVQRKLEAVHRKLEAVRGPIRDFGAIFEFLEFKTLSTRLLILIFVGVRFLANQHTA